MATKMPSQILLISQARSASHMLERIFESQTGLKRLTHPFSSSRSTQLEWMKSESDGKGMAADVLSKFEKEVGVCNEMWQNQLTEAENEGQTLMVHTHLCYPLGPDVVLQYLKSLKERRSDSVKAQNCTVMPDNILLHPGTIPVFTIRDPRLTVPSAHRVMHRMGIEHGGGSINFFTVTNPVWSRALFDFYVSRGIESIVIDADDYITSTDAVRALCIRIGLDPEQLKLSWPAVTEAERQELHPMYYASQSHLFESSKPDPSRAGKNNDLDKDMQGWDKEFEDDAKEMRELVELAKPHYEYLLGKKTKF